MPEDINMSNPDCPDEHILRKYGYSSPGISDRDRKRVDFHLRHCDQCEKRVQAFEAEHISRFPSVDASALNPDGSEGNPLLSVGDYDLFEVIGRSQATVYRARQRPRNRRVAFKIMNSLSENEIDRFRQEAESIAALRHENIVDVIEFGEFNGRYFIAMDLIEGNSLSELIQNQAIDAEQISRILIKVSRALHFAHQNGIIHRDIKPSNILLDENLEPKIVDFGVAKRLDASLTTTGDVIGTPHFMPPEQAFPSKDDAVGPASDVYSIGATLYTALTGTTPFSGTVPEVLTRLRQENPIRPGKIRKSIPIDLESICMKSLEKRAADRYSTAEELALDLECFLNGVMPSATSAIKKKRWKRNIQLTSGISLLLILAISTFVFSTWLGSRKNNPTETRPVTAEPAHRARLRSLSITTDYPGASSEEVEKSLTIPLGSPLREMEGVKHVESFSMDGVSNIQVYFDQESDSEQLVKRCRARLDRIPWFPQSADNPLVQLTDPGTASLDSPATPTYWIVFQANPSESGSDLLLVSEYTVALLKAIQKIEGVEHAEIVGEPKEILNVTCDRNQLSELQVTRIEVENALTVQSNPLFTKSDQLLNTVIKKAGSQEIRIKDVAQLERRWESRLTGLSRTKGSFSGEQIAIGIPIWVSSDSNPVEVGKEIRNRISQVTVIGNSRNSFPESVTYRFLDVFGHLTTASNQESFRPQHFYSLDIYLPYGARIDQIDARSRSADSIVNRLKEFDWVESIYIIQPDNTRLHRPDCSLLISTLNSSAHSEWQIASDIQSLSSHVTEVEFIAKKTDAESSGFHSFRLTGPDRKALVDWADRIKRSALLSDSIARLMIRNETKRELSIQVKEDAKLHYGLTNFDLIQQITNAAGIGRKSLKVKIGSGTYRFRAGTSSESRIIREEGTRVVQLHVNVHEDFPSVPIEQFEDLQVRLNQTIVPLGEIADIKPGVSPAFLHRIDSLPCLMLIPTWKNLIGKKEDIMEFQQLIEESRKEAGLDSRYRLFEPSH